MTIHVPNADDPRQILQLPFASPNPGTSPLILDLAGPIDISPMGGITLTAAQYACPFLYFNGSIPLAGGNVIFPDIVGAVWHLSVADVVFSGRNMTCKSGAFTKTVTIPSTSTSGAMVGVYAPGKMCAFGTPL